MSSLKLPEPTKDQAEYLERIRAAGEDYDRSTIIGGPKKGKTDMADKTFWVLEARWQPPSYMGARKSGSLHELAWTTDIAKAMQFTRQEDADHLFCFMLWSGDEKIRGLVTGPGPVPVVTEHAMISA
jgi:hypothetical protein